MLDALHFFGVVFAKAFCSDLNHFFFGVGERPGFRGEAFDDGRVSVGRNKRGESFDEMPCGAIDASFVTGVQIFFRTAAPFFAARNHFEFDDTFCAEKHRDHAVELLRSVWHVNAGAFF